MSDLKTASVLAFERKLDPSDATFHAGNWDERERHRTWSAVSVQPKSVRGTISNRLKAKEQDPLKLDAAIANPNLQTVDVAALPADCDTLKVAFSLRVLPGTGTPSACNDLAYQQRLQACVAGYVAEQGFRELASRYAANLANGRFLWRNRVGAEQVEVRVEQLQEGKAVAGWTFDALELSLRDLKQAGRHAADLQALAEVVARGLSGEAHVLLMVTAFVRLGPGQEVFPSQELILNRERGQKSRTLYSLKDGGAGIHSQKIGNAIRTIDTWYEGAEGQGPIAVEPYGSVTTQGKAYRQPKQKMDFYTLLDNWMLKDEKPEPGNQHYVMAILVRGGVFGEAGS